MPALFGFSIANPIPADPFATPGVTPFISGTFLAGCDANFDSQIEFLGVLDRAYPQAYVEGLRAKPGGGFELFQAAAKVAERLSIAVNRLECCAFLITAEGGVRATGTVEFTRTADASNTNVTIKAGSIVRTAFGRDFVTLEDVTFVFFELDGPDRGPRTVAIEAVDVGWEYNVPGQVIAANGDVLLGEINQVKCLIIAPSDEALESQFIEVNNIVPTQNGQAACLDGLAFDLDIERALFEDDPPFRLRITETKDTVSPAAIRRGANRLVQARDPTASVCLREVGQPLLPGMFYDAGSSADSPQVTANNFAYDMEPENRPEDRFKFWLSTFEMRGFFLLGIPPLTDDRNFGMAYDGSDSDTFALKNAYDDDTPDNGDAAYDGFPIFDASFLKSISDMVREKKACGVGFDLYIEEIGCF